MQAGTRDGNGHFASTPPRKLKSANRADGMPLEEIEPIPGSAPCLAMDG
jgi:hypothetical protein